MLLGIIGTEGRMGRAINVVAMEAGVDLAGGIDRDVSPATLAKLAAAADVLVDFSSPDALDANLAAAEQAGTPIMIGTTGLEPAHHARIDTAARTIAVLQTANTSLGVTLLTALVEQAAQRLGSDWDIEVVEMHHRHKLDTPSGTALALGAAANAGRGVTLDRFDRMQEGPHAREEGGVYYASLRGGSVAGDHQVIFAGEGERIELGHRAESREIFARGAVRAAQWLAGRPAGRYTMADVLDLR